MANRGFSVRFVSYSKVGVHSLKFSFESYKCTVFNGHLKKVKIHRNTDRKAR